MTGEETTVSLNIVRAPAAEAFDVAMVCVQALHRPALMPLLREIPGRPTIWYLGNTTQGFDDATQQLGKDRVLGGFPGVGGTWEGKVLVYADREKPGDKPFDRLIIGWERPTGYGRGGPGTRPGSILNLLYYYDNLHQELIVVHCFFDI